ncbi:MAG: radical SAM protein [Candidatus Methanoperedens sp.]|nr:radical SAM protein [Candidatus Methanoperedens sp.]
MTDYSEFVMKNLHRLDGFRAYFPRSNPTFNNPAFEEASLRVLIVRLSPFPNIRESITHHFLFQETRRALPSAYIDYAFFPNPKNIPIFRDCRIPFFLGIQSLHPISDFDLVLVSNSFTLELFNLPYLFMNTGIPAAKKERRQAKPIVVMGGSNAFMAQCAISPEGDSFVDALFFGEGEGAVSKIVSIVNENQKLSKTEILGILEKEVPGFFDIRMPIPDSMRVSPPKAPQASHILADYPILNTDIENTAKLQITQGCSCFCSFCFEGYTRKPFREYSPKDILEKALEIKSKHAPTQFDFLSFNFNMHTDISRIIADLNEIAKFVSFKSQRADIIAMCPGLLDVEILSGKRTYTIGVEGISDRMRRYLHKSLAEGELILALEHIYAKKPRQLKLFFMITGIENESDRREFKDFVMKLKQLKSRLAPGCRTIMSFGLLVNLPFTPMQFASVIEPASIKQIKGELKRDCETNGFEFRMTQDMEEFLISQHIAIGGFECFNVLSLFANNGGYFDGEHIAGDKNALISSLRSASGDGLHASKDENYVYPFEKLRGAPDKSFLYRMYNEARNFRDSGYCLDGKGECIDCGGCEDRKLLKVPEVTQDDINRLKKTVEMKKKPQVVQAVVTIKEGGRFLTPEAKCAFTGMVALSHLPSIVKDYLSCRQLQNMPASKGYGFLFGRFLYDFEFMSGSEVFLEFLKKGAIETPILSISHAGDKEIGTHFRVTSKWDDRSPYGFQNLFQDFLLTNGLGFDIKKSNGVTRFEVAEKDRKKKFLYSAALRQENGVISLEIETDSRFSIIEMLKHLFGEKWVDVMVESIE